MRRSPLFAFAVATLLLRSALAEEPARKQPTASDAANQSERKALGEESARKQPTASDAASQSGRKALTEDLRYGHFFASASTGLWVPSASMVPAGQGLTAPNVGWDARGRLGVAISGYAVGFVEGGVARALGRAGCDACAATSISVGVGVSAHLTQGFAVDPWVSYAVAYRDTLLAVDDVAGAVSDAPVHAIDFGRIAFGFDHAPIPWLGLGPFVATDLGVRLFDRAIYADFVAGLRVTFEPSASSRRLTIDGAR